MSKRLWAYQPSLYRETLEHFFTSKTPVDIPCMDKKAAVALRHGLHRYFNQTAEEAEKGNAAAARLAVIIPDIMATIRETVVVVALRAERINVDFEAMAAAVAARAEHAQTTMSDLKAEQPAEKKKNTYY